MIRDDIHAAMLALARGDSVPTVKPLVVTEADNVPCHQAAATCRTPVRHDLQTKSTSKGDE
jgi:hypothetical protein